MPIITADKPDRKYYCSIMQLPDLTWSSEQLPLDDIQTVLPGFTSPDPQHLLTIPGLRSKTATGVVEQAASLVNKYAPADVQRNALHILSTTTTGTPYTNARDTMDWVMAVNAYRDAQVANVKTLNFDQCVAYITPVGIPPWPAPPACLTS